MERAAGRVGYGPPLVVASSTGRESPPEPFGSLRPARTMVRMWRRVAFLLTLFVLAGYAYQPLWGAGPIGSDLLTLLDAGEVAWPTERGDGTFEPLDLYSVHGVDERPLAACVLAVESRLLTLPPPFV